MNYKAIAYARCSTDMQEASIPEQKKFMDKYANDHDLEIMRYFEDEGRSGRNAEERPAFMQMMEYVKNRNDFKFVLVYDVSRWGRFENPKEATYWEMVCEKAGKKVKYTSESYINDESMGAFITKVVKDSEASEYSSKLSKTSFRGHKHYAEQGYHVGGGKKYGYARLLLDESGKPIKVLASGERKAIKTQRVRLVKGDPEEVKIIQRIYDMYVNKNYGITKICKFLNNEGIPSPKNKGWSKSTVWTILHDETYIGWVVWNRHVCKNLQEKNKGWIKYKPHEEWIIYKGAHEPIVSEDLFRTVQAKTRQAYIGGYRFKGKGRGYHTPYLLSGIIKCIKCNGNYQGRLATHRTREKTYETRYYICGNYTMKENCEKWNLPKDVVENNALKFIMKRLANPIWLNSIREKLEDKIRVIKNESSKDVGKIDAELKDVQSRIMNLTDAVERGFDKDVASSRIRELKSKRDRLLDMRAELDRKAAIKIGTTESIDNILKRLNSFKKDFEQAEIPTRKALLTKFIYEIRVDPVEKKCYYYMKKMPDFDGEMLGESASVKFGANSHHQLYSSGVKFGTNPHHHSASPCDVL